MAFYQPAIASSRRPRRIVGGSCHESLNNTFKIQAIRVPVKLTSVLDSQCIAPFRLKDGTAPQSLYGDVLHFAWPIGCFAISNVSRGFPIGAPFSLLHIRLCRSDRRRHDRCVDDTG